jgi:hypothetical protein
LLNIGHLLLDHTKALVDSVVDVRQLILKIKVCLILLVALDNLLNLWYLTEGIVEHQRLIRLLGLNYLWFSRMSLSLVVLVKAKLSRRYSLVIVKWLLTVLLNLSWLFIFIVVQLILALTRLQLLELHRLLIRVLLVNNVYKLIQILLFLLLCLENRLLLNL